MTRKKLLAALRDAAQGISFSFFTGFDYRIATEFKHLPAIWVFHPKLTEKEGRLRGFKVYNVEMLLAVEASAGKDAALAWLEEKAVAITNLLLENEEITSLQLTNSNPVKEQLTPDGETAIRCTLSITVQFTENTI